MRVLMMAVLAAASIVSGTCQAHPEDGLWWNADQSGRGWMIETQNEVMIVTSYTYDEAGNPLWYLSPGQYNPQTRRFTSTLETFRDGQCLGCAYSAPQGTGSDGALSINFTSDDSAVLIQDGEQVPITRFYAGWADKQDMLTGAWSLVGEVAFGIMDSEVLSLDGETFTDDGVEYLVARRVFSTSGVGLASPFEDGAWLLLLDSSTNFYKAYLFEFGKARAEGVYWLYRKDESPTGNGSWLRGYRENDKAEVQASAAFVVDERDAKNANLLAPAKTPMPSAIEARLQAMKATLQSLD